jgi:hypothetical protein
MAEKPAMPLKLREILSAAAAGALAYQLIAHLPGIVSAFACAVAIALGSYANTRLTRPYLWWASVGAVAGSVVGAGSMLATTLAEGGVDDRSSLRYLVIGTLGIAGLAAGIFLGKDPERESIPKPAQFLKRASGLTVVLFAVIVTLRFPNHGLDSVRALSSRLSTMMTIVVTSIAVPGWIGFLIGTRVKKRLRARLSGLRDDEKTAEQTSTVKSRATE